jgi:hypothetical protein
MIKKLLIWISVTGSVLFCAQAIIKFPAIHKQVDKITTIATNNFNKNPVESLIDLINSGKFSFKEKYSAIWALGKFANPKALPFVLYSVH